MPIVCVKQWILFFFSLHRVRQHNTQCRLCPARELPEHCLTLTLARRRRRMASRIANRAMLKQRSKGGYPANPWVAWWSPSHCRPRSLPSPRRGTLLTEARAWQQ